MKIGILTYHRAENYGALLQAYALLTYLRSLGHDVSFVDYWPKYHSDYFKIFSWEIFSKKGFKGKVLMLVNTVLPSKHIRKYRLQCFMRDRLGLNKSPKYCDMNDITEHYDAVIYGSDQIWRKQNLDGVGFDDWYFGSNNVVSDKKIVYAGSMGTISTTCSDDEYVKKMTQNFDYISVRERNLQDYLLRLGVQSIQVLDPVFLLTKDQWRSIALSSQKGGYILFYNLLGGSESENFAANLSKVKKMPVVEINKRIIRRKGAVRDASVERFLQLIADADYVVSNSFHGVAFSIIFEKQFFAVGMGERANRVISLLLSMGLESRYVKNTDVTQIQQITDYKIINTKRREVVNNSKSFILHTLN